MNNNEEMFFSNPFCKIQGDERVNKAIINAKKFQFTFLNLNEVETILNAIIKNLEHYKSEQVLSSLTKDAIITYAKCFIDGYGYRLSHSLFDDKLRPDAFANEITERDFHNLVMNYRHKHIAHSDTLLTEIDIGACWLENGILAVCPVIVSRISTEDIDFYSNFRKLVMTAKQKLDSQMQYISNELTTLIQNGNGQVTNEVLKLKPVRDVKSMWGLE